MAVILAVVTVSIFARTLGMDFVHWDDDIHVYDNPHLLPLSAANTGYFWTHAYEKLYIPISYGVYALLASAARMPQPDPQVTVIGGVFNPHVFHAANVVLHTLNALLVFAILRRITQRPAPSLIGALLFAVHPLQVESVAWVSEMRGVLCGFLSLAALYTYIIAVAPGDASVVAVFRRREYWAAFILFAMALLSKPAAVTLPLGMLIVDHWALRPGRSRPQPLTHAVIAAAPMLIAALPLIPITHSVQPIPESSAWPLWSRPVVALDALAFYLGKLLLPIGLTLDYGRKPLVVIGHWWGYVTWLAPAAAGIVVYRLRRRYPNLVAASLFSVVMLLPVLGLVPFIYQQFSTVSDRYMYLAMFGPALAVATLLSCDMPKVWARIAIAASAIALTAFAGLSVVQEAVWSNTLTLLGHAVAMNPQSYNIRTQYGLAIGDTGDVEGSIEQFQLALQTNPNWPPAHANLGRAFVQEGFLDQAIEQFQDAVNLEPNVALTRHDLAVSLRRSGRMAEAAVQFDAVVKIIPGSANDHDLYGLTLMDLGRYGDAAREFSAALSLNPGLVDARQGLAAAQAHAATQLTTVHR